MTTIKQVAQRANVSIATVSYVLNDTGSVSESTRRSVLDAVAALGYRPSYRGRALKAQRSMSIGVVLPSVARAGAAAFGELLAGLTGGATARGYHVLLSAAGHDQPEEALYEPLFQSGRIDGVAILDVQQDDPRIAAARAANMPYICAGRPDDDSPFVAIDVHAGMLEALAHLIVRGHERIALLQPPLERTLAGEQDAAYEDAFNEAGLAFDAALVIEGGVSEADGYAAAEELLALPEPPGAIVGGSAALTFGALHAIHDSGRLVGRDVALISFEDTQAAAHTAPPLTAVRQPFMAWGRALADGMIDLIAGRSLPQIVLSPQLIVRHSCGE